jgi:hypothetical protein
MTAMLSARFWSRDLSRQGSTSRGVRRRGVAELIGPSNGADQHAASSPATARRYATLPERALPRKETAKL